MTDLAPIEPDGSVGAALIAARLQWIFEDD
jgi:hypothetical protein